MSYEGSDDEQELEMVPIVSQNNNNINIVGNSAVTMMTKNKKFFLMKISIKS